MKIHVRKCVAPSGTSSFVEKFSNLHMGDDSRKRARTK